MRFFGDTDSMSTVRTELGEDESKNTGDLDPVALPLPSSRQSAVTMRLGIARIGTDSVTVRWQDAGSGRPAGAPQPDAVPILIGQLRLDVSTQVPGWYTLETAVTDRAGRTVVGRRRLRLVE